MLSFFDRLDKYMKYKGLNDNKITIDANLGNGIIGKGRKRGALSQDSIAKILYTYQELNANWLFTGEGKMLKGDQIELLSNKPESQTSIYKLRTDYFGVERQQIPLYEVEASAGLALLFSNQTTQIPIDHITIPNAPKCDGAMFVRGDSMYPILKAGDIACYKVINNLDNVIFGEKYILDISNEDDDYLTVKYVKKSDKGVDYFKLVSENQHHAEREIHTSTIRAIAMVKVTIRFETLA